MEGPDEDYRVNGYASMLLARSLVLAGRHDEAITQLESILGRPRLYSPGWLRVDPAFAALEGNARFERLAAGS